MIPKLPKDIYVRTLPPVRGPVAVDWTKNGVVQLVDVIDDSTHQVTEAVFQENYTKVPDAERIEMAVQVAWAGTASLIDAFHKITGALT